MEIIRLKRQIADLKGKITNTRNKYFQESQTDMTKAEEELSTQEQELTDKRITTNFMDRMLGRVIGRPCGFQYKDQVVLN